MSEENLAAKVKKRSKLAKRCICGRYTCAWYHADKCTMFGGYPVAINDDPMATRNFEEFERVMKAKFNGEEGRSAGKG